MQCEILALELHLLQIIGFPDLGADPAEYCRALEALRSHKCISNGHGIVVIDCILLNEVGILSPCIIHHVLVLDQGIHTAAEYHVLVGLDTRFHRPQVLVHQELS